MKILVLNGVNLNLTGRREQSVYGTRTLEEINASLKAYAAARGHEAEFLTTNCEGKICSMRARIRTIPTPSATRSRRCECPSSKSI